MPVHGIRARRYRQTRGPRDSTYCGYGRRAVVSRWLRPGEVAGHGGWDIWRLREVGGWGDAGRIVGLRWEEVGGQAALDVFGDRLIPLWTDRALGRWLGTVGLPNADAI